MGKGADGGRKKRLQLLLSLLVLFEFEGSLLRRRYRHELPSVVDLVGVIGRDGLASEVGLTSVVALLI